MEKKTVCSDRFVQMNRLENGTFEYLFKFPESFSFQKKRSTFLQYFSSEWCYMSADALKDLIKGAFELLKEKLDKRDTLLLKRVSETNNEEKLQTILWEYILAGENLAKIR